MPVETDQTQAVDPGLFTLVVLLRHYGIRAGAEQVRQRCGTAMIGIAEMLRCAKELGFKARTRTTKWDRLAGMPLPGIAALRNGGFLLVAKVAQNKAMVAHPRSPHIETMSRAQFEAIWDGRLVLMTRHNSLSDLAGGLVRPFANMAEEGMRRLARRNRQYLTRRGSRRR